MRIFRRSLPATAAALLFIGLHASVRPATAGTNVSGVQTGSWTVSGSPYTVTGDVTIPVGQSLTWQAGVIILLDSSADIIVQGTLVSLGTAASPIGLLDSDGTWGAIIAQPGSTVDLRGTTLVDGGYGGPAASLVALPGTASVSWRGGGVVSGQGHGALINATTVSLHDLTFSDNTGDGLNITSTSPASLDTLTLFDNGGYALNINSNPGSFPKTLLGEGNAKNAIHVSGQLGGATAARRWTWAAISTLPYVVGSLTVDGLDTLDLDPGAIVKVDVGGGISVGASGRLQTQGALSAARGRVRPQSLVPLDQPVWITSAKDDAHGGDSNGDGAATKATAGDWNGVVLDAGAQLRLKNTWIAYAGNNGAAVRTTGATADLVEMTGGGVLFSYVRAIDAATVGATLTGAQFSRNGGGVNLAMAAAGAVHGCAFFSNSNATGPVLMNTFGGAHACINATGCWWGSPTGPHHAAGGVCAPVNNGAGQSVDHNVIFDFWLSANPTNVPPGNPVLLSPIFDDTVRADTTRLRWAASVDLDGEPVTYSLRVAHDPDFTQMVLSQDNFTGTSLAGTGWLGSGARYHWTVVARDGHGAEVMASPQTNFFTTLASPVVEVEAPRLPSELSLTAPSPNPSRGTTRLRFALPRSGMVSLVVFDLAGRRVRELYAGVAGAGEHEARWDGRLADGREAPAGMYFARLRAGGQSRVRSLLRTR